MGQPDQAGNASHAGSASQAGRAAAVAAALQRWYRPAAGQWRTARWWNSANAVTALAGYTAATGDRAYLSVLAATFTAAGRRHPDFITRYHDDTGWWALAWVAAFDVTGDRRYLDAAATAFRALAAGWDSQCGGGLWWNTARRYKNAITSELFLTLAARLHQRAPGGGGYRDWALRAWDWFDSSGLIGPSGLVNDGLTAECANNGDTTWTYNQGVILGGLAALADLTGDRAYAARGQAIADAAVGTLARPRWPGGPPVLTEPHEARTKRRDADRPQFKGIFVRYLADLHRCCPRPGYRELIADNARCAWQRSRNDRNEIGLNWAGPFDRAGPSRQCAALDLFSAAAALAAG